MKKGLIIVLIVILCIICLGLVGGIIAFAITGNAASAKEYKIGYETIASVKEIVGKRRVTSVSTKNTNGVITKKIEYKSDSVQEDLLKYINYLRNEGGFALKKDMDLTKATSTVELGKSSLKDGKLIMLTIDYNVYGYTIIMQLGEGTLYFN